MATPQLSGQQGGTITRQGRVPAGFIPAGTSTSLPATLDNGIVALRFVAHPTRGVTLDTLVHQEDETAALVENAQDFTWTNVQGSTADGEHDGGLWRIRTQPGSAWSDGWSDAWGSGFADTEPSATVTVTTTVDPDGREALLFRWTDIDLPNAGTVDVALLVSLGVSDRMARWWLAATRDGEAVDGIEWVECPRLAFVAPVAARAGLTHAESQERARVLLPAFDRPALDSENTPLSLWAGVELVTHHPTGGTETTTQPLQFEALAAVDPQDTASLQRILFLGSADAAGTHKRFVRAGTSAGDQMVYRWAHRYYPPWAAHPALDTDDASRFGSVSYPRYPALVGCLHSPTAAWWHTAAAHYRDQVAARMARTPKRYDTRRSDLARGTPWVGVIDQTPNMDGATVGALAVDWAEDHRLMVGADRAVVQVHPLRPSITRATPPLAYESIRGCNYLPMATSSHCLHLALVPLRGEFWTDTQGGFFWEPHAAQEIAVLADVGFNAIRFWGSFTGWCADPDGYLASLKAYCALLRAQGMRMNYILFNAIPAGAAAAGLGARDLLVAASYSPATLKTVLWTLCDTWNTVAAATYPLPTDEVDVTHYPEPMTHLGWLDQGRFGEWSDTTFQTLVGQYVRAMAQFFAQDEDAAAAFLSYDLFNEMNLQYAPNNIPNATLREYLLDFIGQCGKTIRELHPSAAFTVGWAGNPTDLTTELLRRGCVLDYLSGHSYNYEVSTPAAHEQEWANIAATMAQAKAEADVLGVPLVWSEFFVLPENDGEMSRYLDPLTALGAGGFTWCYLRNNAYRAGPKLFDGIANCDTPAKQIRRDMYGNAWSDGWSDGWGGSALRFTVEYPVDDAAVRAWVLT